MAWKDLFKEVLQGDVLAPEKKPESRDMKIIKTATIVATVGLWILKLYIDMRRSRKN